MIACKYGVRANANKEQIERSIVATAETKISAESQLPSFVQSKQHTLSGQQIPQPIDPQRSQSPQFANPQRSTLVSQPQQAALSAQQSAKQTFQLGQFSQLTQLQELSSAANFSGCSTMGDADRTLLSCINLNYFDMIAEMRRALKMVRFILFY